MRAASTRKAAAADRGSMDSDAVPYAPGRQQQQQQQQQGGGGSASSTSTSSATPPGPGRRAAPAGGAGSGALGLSVWSLRLRPAQLDRAFWAAKAKQPETLNVDAAVCNRLLLSLAATGWLQGALQHGWRRGAAGFLPVLLFWGAWAAALAGPHSHYARRRLAYLVAARAALAAMQWSAFAPPPAGTPMAGAAGLGSVAPALGPGAALAVQAVLLTCPLVTAVEAAGLQLPFAWQLLALAAKAGAVLFGAGMRGMVARLAPEAQYQLAAGRMLDAARSAAAAAAAVAVPRHGSLEGRSCDVFMFASLVVLAGSAVLLWACYLLLRSDVRAWLGARAGRGEAEADGGEADGDEADSDAPVKFGGGLVVTRRQLAALHDATAPAGAALGGHAGRLAALAARACVAALLLNLSLLANELLALQLLPRLGGARFIDGVCPPVATGRGG